MQSSSSVRDHRNRWTPALHDLPGARSAAAAADGKIFMPPDDYGFSQRFAWVQDRFGFAWQLNVP